MVNPKNTNPVQSDPIPKPTSNGKSKTNTGSGHKTGSSTDVTDEADRPDWLPAGWKFKQYLRTSGASAGTKDKYFIDPVTNRRFRSRKEVVSFLESGITPNKRKASDADADKTKSETTKSKKPESKQLFSIKDFKFDDIPEKVEWVLMDSYEGNFSPKINGIDWVPESSQGEWYAAFTYLTLQVGGKDMF